MKEIIICGIGLLGALITYFLVPLLKDKTELTQRQFIVERMKTAFCGQKKRSSGQSKHLREVNEVRKSTKRLKSLSRKKHLGSTMKR